MQIIKALSLAVLLGISLIRGFSQGIPVIDASAVTQALQQVAIATQQLEQARAELTRLGDPGLVRTQGAESLMQSIKQLGVAKTLDEIASKSTGSGGVNFTGSGLYRAPSQRFTTADGETQKRDIDSYRKYDAIAQASKSFEDVLRDTEERRQSVRKQIQRTLDELQSATTMADVQKLQGVLTAQNAELATIDRERDAAFGRVMVQNINNQNDAARQSQARLEESRASLRKATEKVGHVLTPDTSPAHFPDPTGH